MVSMAISLASSPAAAPPIPSATMNREPRSPTSWSRTCGSSEASRRVRSATRKRSSLWSRVLPRSVLAQTWTLIGFAERPNIRQGLRARSPATLQAGHGGQGGNRAEGPVIGLPIYPANWRVERRDGSLRARANSPHRPAHMRRRMCEQAQRGSTRCRARGRAACAARIAPRHGHLPRRDRRHSGARLLVSVRHGAGDSLRRTGCAAVPSSRRPYGVDRHDQFRAHGHAHAARVKGSASPRAPRPAPRRSPGPVYGPPYLLRMFTVATMVLPSSRVTMIRCTPAFQLSVLRLKMYCPSSRNPPGCFGEAGTTTSSVGPATRTDWIVAVAVVTRVAPSG